MDLNGLKLNGLKLPKTGTFQGLIIGAWPGKKFPLEGHSVNLSLLFVNLLELAL